MPSLLGSQGVERCDVRCGLRHKPRTVSVPRFRLFSCGRARIPCFNLIGLLAIVFSGCVAAFMVVLGAWLNLSGVVHLAVAVTVGDRLSGTSDSISSCTRGT
jgi:hypothetical protein